MCCDLMMGSAGSRKLWIIGMGGGELMSGAGTMPGAAAVLQSVECLGQELCLNY